MSISGPKGRILVLFGNIPMLGQERGNIEAISALRERGWDALFITHHKWGHLHVQPELDRHGLPWAVATYADRFQRGMGLTGWLLRLLEITVGSWQLLRILRSYRPTHVHLCNSAWFLSFLPVLLFTRIPVVYRLGDAPPRHRWIHRAFWRHLLIPRVSRFVCISRFIAGELGRMGPVDGKVTVIYSRPPGRRPSSENLPEQSPSFFTFAYVGQLISEKGVAELVEAAICTCMNDRRARFIVVGDFTWRNPFAQSLIADVREAGQENQIVFLGYVQDVERLLRAADVHLCPSLCPEALGSTVLEAKRGRLPSIIFPSGGLPEIVTHGVDGLVCRETTAVAIEAACRYYLNKPALARKHGEAAHESLVRLEVNKFSERWDEVYESIAETDTT